MKTGNSPSTVETMQDAFTKRGGQLANGIEDGIHSAHDAAQSALSNVSDTLDNLQNEARPAIKRFAARGAEMAQSGIDATREAGIRARAAASRYADACESYVSEQPMKSVAIAAAAGAVLAALLMIARNRSNSRARFYGRL